MASFASDPRELQAVKDALTNNAANFGVGILHEPTGKIHLIPFDSLPHQGGHGEFVTRLQLPPSTCKGFAIVKHNDQFLPVNLSHLNGAQGQPGSLQMPPLTFAGIVRALENAGL